MDRRKNPAAKGESPAAADKESILLSPNTVYRNAEMQAPKMRDEEGTKKVFERMVHGALA
jgi:hypothetical protein